MIYGYCRCSTDETKQDIARQERELIAMRVDVANIYTEYVNIPVSMSMLSGD
jgi:DNA invertase Pin-like site-specific DNA recombinase